MNEERTTLLEFPCEFPFKIFGLNQKGLEGLVMEKVLAHVPLTEKPQLSSRLSTGSKYRAVTITIQAQSKEQLDAIYRDLSACPEVAMVL